ncbi:MAG: hypothetical protein H0X71_08740 [Rubrobacter sp.]|nr:hypothetical protein [Rubrobacter sp.]
MFGISPRDQTEMQTTLQHGCHTKGKERERPIASPLPQHDPGHVLYAALLVLLQPGLLSDPCRGAATGARYTHSPSGPPEPYTALATLK